MDQIMEFAFNRGQNIFGKGENAGYQESIKLEIVWY